MKGKVAAVAEELVHPILERHGLELVEVEYKKEGANWFLRVFIDSPNGVDVDTCSLVSEHLSQALDEKDPVEHAYILEVSSAGAERPLKTHRDFERAIGKRVHLKTYEPVGMKKEFEGDLIQFDGESFLLDQPGSSPLSIPLDKVASVRLAVTF